MDQGEGGLGGASRGDLDLDAADGDGDVGADL